MSAGYERADHRPLREPVLVVAMEGWIDAGFAAAGAAGTLLGGLDTEPVATFDSDELLDHRARRPVLSIVDGVSERLAWPGIELRAARDLNGRDLLLLVGAEPDHSWRAFAIAVLDIAQELDTRMLVHLGAYPAAVPHTRQALLSITAAKPELAHRWTFGRGTLDVPAGIQAVLERFAGDRGMDALGLWAQVPHYTSAAGYPAASLALLEALATVSGLALPSGDLEVEARNTEARLDEAVARNPEHKAMIELLEQQADSATGVGPLPSGDELAAEVERFLRGEGER
ncbi:MAG: PAC2 family protein [Actinobacteria bacterium]|nr:PAC2 family protein [Actinomycetota bacterium]